jgi:hypothetical protein
MQPFPVYLCEDLLPLTKLTKVFYFIYDICLDDICLLLHGHVGYFISDKQHCATPSCSLNDNCSAGRLYHCDWRARQRLLHTHATCGRRNDANASS